MLIINTAVEQFCTALDETICDRDPSFLALHHDDRLFIVVRAVGYELPDHVHVRQTWTDRLIVTATPGPDLRRLAENIPPNLPSRTVQFDARKPLISSAGELMTRFSSAVLGVSEDCIEDAIVRYATMMHLIGNGAVDVAGWDEYGILRTIATAAGAASLDEPIGTEIFSAIGKHRIKVWWSPILH